MLKAASAARPAALLTGAIIVVLVTTTVTFDYAIAKLTADAIMVQIQAPLVVQDTHGHSVHVTPAIGNILYHIQVALLIKVAALLHCEFKDMHVTKNGLNVYLVLASQPIPTTTLFQEWEA